MKKTKMFISIFMALAILTASMVPAFAMTDAELQLERNKLRGYASDCVSEYVQYFQVVPIDVPIWSDASEQRIQEAADKIYAEVNKYTTEEEFEAGYAIMDDAVDKLCISSTELEWMLDYMKKDYNSTGYYDEETTAKIKTIYEEALAAYESGTEREIHVAYINMRNLLDDICLYNPVPGDVDKSGKFNVKDIALMQLDLAKINNEEFTSSQNFISFIFHNTTIANVANWQLELAKLNTSSRVDLKNEQLATLSENKGIDVDLKHWFGGVENNNPMYDYDRYVWWI